MKAKNSIMAQDFDYVLMEYYKKDTSDLINQSLNIIKHKNAEIKRLHEVIGAILTQVDTVKIPLELFNAPEKLGYEYYQDASVAALVMKTQEISKEKED